MILPLSIFSLIHSKMNVTTNTQGRDINSLRPITFVQQSVNPATSDPVNNPYGNTIRIRFPMAQSFYTSEIALAKLNVFYSWYNITAAFGNNIFQYAFPTLGGYMTFTVTIPDGFYSIDTLNQIFQQIQVANGTYLINTVSGANVFFLYWVTNDTFYRTTLFSNPIPAAGAGYDIPSNYPGGGPPATQQSPALIVLPTTAPAGSGSTDAAYSFSKVLGFLPGEYPTAVVAMTGTSQSFNGQFAPQIESTTSVNVSCSIANSGTINANPNVLFNFSPEVPFGFQIVVNPPYPIFVPITDSPNVAYVDITLLDDNGRLLNLQDPHISGMLIVRGK